MEYVDHHEMFFYFISVIQDYIILNHVAFVYIYRYDIQVLEICNKVD